MLFLFSPHFTSFMLKQLVTMEVIHWATLWETYKDEFENEKNLLGGSLVPKAAEDLKLRIIEHVCIFYWLLSSFLTCLFYCFLELKFYFVTFSEYFGSVKVLFKDNLKTSLWITMPQFAGLVYHPFLNILLFAWLCDPHLFFFLSSLAVVIIA